MSRKSNRYHIMERNISLLLIVNTVLFILYLIVAGKGVTWAKITLSLVVILISAGILGYLKLTRELTHPRSLWMTLGAAAIALCTLVSLIFAFPRPKPVYVPGSGTPETTQSSEYGQFIE